MRRLGAIAVMLALAAPALGAPKAETPAKCDVGPVTRNYSGTPWLVYSCHDQYRLLFIAAPVNPAGPGTIILSRTGDALHTDILSTGDRRTASEAGEAIRGLTPEEFDALLGQTKAP